VTCTKNYQLNCQMKNTIDIIVPYWGDFSLLRQTVDSILAQTSDAWHLTILDDHYPDKTAQSYYKELNNKRITYIRHRKNIGITANFNYAIQYASAPYCMIVGCDDKLLPDYVETTLKNIGEADFYQPGVQVIDDKNNVYLPLADKVKRILQPKKSGMLTGEKLATLLCHGNWLYFPSITWKTDTIKRYSFDTKYKILEDVIIELTMIIDGASLYFDTTETFQYRRFAESLSSKEKGKNGIRFGEEKEVYNTFADRFDKIGWKKAARAAKLRVTSRIHSFLSRF
jgi:glycosyltransferase involved in cell wall biosynthesis